MRFTYPHLTILCKLILFSVRAATTVRTTSTIQCKHNQAERERARVRVNELLSHSLGTHAYHNLPSAHTHTRKRGKYGSRSHVDIVIVASLFLLHMFNVLFRKRIFSSSSCVYHSHRRCRCVISQSSLLGFSIFDSIKTTNETIPPQQSVCLRTHKHFHEIVT